MIKGEKPFFLKSIAIVAAILFVEAGFFMWYFPRKGITGNAIINFSDAFSSINPTSRVFLLVQWFIIAFILLVLFLKNKGVWRRNKEKEGIDLEKLRKKSKTNLDSLYFILQDKKQVSIRTVCDVFQIKEDLALEWARILEAGELASLEYPGFGSPLIVLAEPEDDDKSKPKDKSKPLPSKEGKSKDVKADSKKTVPAQKPVAKKVVSKGEKLASDKNVLPPVKPAIYHKRVAKRAVKKMIKDLKKKPIVLPKSSVSTVPTSQSSDKPVAIQKSEAKRKVEELINNLKKENKAKA